MQFSHAAYAPMQVRALLSGEPCKMMKIAAPLVGLSFNTASGQNTNT